jgi:hypothetical protein
MKQLSTSPKILREKGVTRFAKSRAFRYEAPRFSKSRYTSELLPRCLALGFVLIVLCLITTSAQKKPTLRPDPALAAAAMKCLDEYMTTWNSKDIAAWERTFHFPHYRLASGKMTVLERPGMQNPKLFESMTASGWHHSQWERRKIIHAAPDKIHVDTKFTRYRADGSVLGSYESLYILTKEDGRWGVKMRSSFAQ